MESASKNNVITDSCSLWLCNVINTIDTIHSHGPKFQYTSQSRLMQNCLCIPLCCFPCFLWSTLLRCFCCPISCFKGDGPLSNNGCTNASDKCISHAIKEVNKHEVCPSPPSSEDAFLAIKYASSLITQKESFQNKNYWIAEYLTPAVSCVKIEMLQRHIDDVVTHDKQMIDQSERIMKLMSIESKKKATPFDILEIASSKFDVLTEKRT